MLLASQGCDWFRVEKEPPHDTPTSTHSKIPFSVKDPSRFSSEIVISSFGNGNVVERRYFVAIDGRKRLEKFGIGTKTEFHLLAAANGETYRIDPALKEYELLSNRPLSSKPDSLRDTLISRWLNENKNVTFKDLGIERGLRKYKVEAEGAKDTEIFVFVDEILSYPVRQEIYSVSDNNRKLTFKAEFKSISTDPSPGLFELPDEYRPRLP